MWFTANNYSYCSSDLKLVRVLSGQRNQSTISKTSRKKYPTFEKTERYNHSNSAFENGKASLIFFLTLLKLLFWLEKNGWSFHDSMELFFVSLCQEETGASQLLIPPVIFNKINNLIDFSNVIFNGYI